ncbi:MAG: hypothetical protein C4523_00275 [Myxococcales bacterium]|nr:MAG: hypothetical protein C4523_00275 [Myxococcales bacterium]
MGAWFALNSRRGNDMTNSTRMAWILAAALALLSIPAGCSSDGGEAQTDGDEMTDGDEEAEIDEDALPACWTDLAEGEKIALADGLSGTEGITFDGKGKLYAASATMLMEISPDGIQRDVAPFSKAVGIAAAEDGSILVCDFGPSDEVDVRDGVLWRVSPEGDAQALSEGAIANANFPVRTPWGSWLVSDDFAPEIWEITDDGEATLWTNEIPSPNGMVFSADGKTLYVANTFDQDSRVFAVSVVDGEAAGVEEFTRLDPGSVNDGMAMDEDGNLYVAANIKGQIVRVALDGSYETLVGGMTTPASLAFGEGEGFDPCSLYVTELAGAKIWRVAVGVRGARLYR